MKAKLYVNQMKLGGSAQEYLQQVKRAPRATKAIEESRKGGAQEILQTVQAQENFRYELDINIQGKDLIHQMNEDFEFTGLIPYFFNKTAHATGEGIRTGDRVMIPYDDRKFIMLSVSCRNGSCRIRYEDGDSEYVVPWVLVQPYPEQE
jgi:hypothetical protein